MANTIALRKAYSTMLDEVYKLASLTNQGGYGTSGRKIIFRKKEVKRYGKYNCIKKSIFYYA